MIAKRGEFLLCHVCRIRIAEVACDIVPGTPLTASLFKSVGPWKIEDGEPATCPKCYSPIIFQGTLSIEKKVEEISNDPSQFPLSKPE